MKKILLLIAMIGVLMGIISCSNDDEPRSRSVTTVTYPMFNHMTSGSNVIGMATTQNKLVLDTAKHIATLELNYNDGHGDKQLKIEDVIATPKRLNFYELSSPSNSSFKGYADLNELSFRYSYTTADGIRVISMTPEVFFRNLVSTITYDDTTKTTVDKRPWYQFTIDANNGTAIIDVMDILHAKDLKQFINITASNVPFTVTANGFTISATNLKTIATYYSYVDSTGTDKATTNKYPFQTFNATVDLVNDHLDANYMISNSATVVATGKTYPD